jgi:2-amino-4-hydroxy-6-hydroxymethyldihydropteridine diphosphokinase
VTPDVTRDTAPGGSNRSQTASARDDEQDAWISLGSNLGDREAHLAAAIQALRDSVGVRVVAVSAVYETDPVGPGPQGPYLNAAAQLRTSLPPRALLDRLLAIEEREGRERGAVRNAARTLDLDLLLYADRQISEPGLEVPHPRMHERPFVLEPLRDLAAEVMHPGQGETIDDLARRVRDPVAVRGREPRPDWAGS